MKGQNIGNAGRAFASIMVLVFLTAGCSKREPKKLGLIDPVRICQPEMGGNIVTVDGAFIPESSLYCEKYCYLKFYASSPEGGQRVIKARVSPGRVKGGIGGDFPIEIMMDDWKGFNLRDRPRVRITGEITSQEGDNSTDTCFIRVSNIESVPQP